MDKFENAFNKAHDIEFDAYKFDEPNYDALIVTEESFLEHLRVQAAGLAYYGTLAKSAERDYDELEKRYKNRYNEMYSECSDIILRAGKKNSVKDVESFIMCKYEKEIETWENQLKEAKINKDGISSYYEAWKAKGFILNSMTSLVTAGLIIPKTSISENDFKKTYDKKMNIVEARNILNNK